MARATTFEQTKKANRRMRRCAPVGIIHSGGMRTVLDCCLCGATHTCATSYRQAKHVSDFRNYHDSEQCQDEARIADAKNMIGFHEDTPTKIIEEWFAELAGI